MSRVVATIALLAALASSESLRGKTALRQRKTVFRQDPDASDEKEYSDQETVLVNSNDSGDTGMASSQADSSDSSPQQVPVSVDISEGSSTSSDDSGDTDTAKSQETPDDSDSLQDGKKAFKRVMIAAKFNKDRPSGTIAHEPTATETEGIKGVDSAETGDADAAVSDGQGDQPAGELSRAEGGDGGEQLAAASGGAGGSGKMHSDDNEITERLQEAQKLDGELVAPKGGDTHSQGTSMSAADSHSTKYDGEHDDADMLANQGKPSDISTQDQEGATEADDTQAASATGDDSADAATVQLKEEQKTLANDGDASDSDASDTEDASDD